ncbi:MAG: Jag N-terminal domain-containing protein, partial [Oscillospiraceae bacterium]|nr:Jag N-terminal domain-containing protein [Oscillospiraceae bacterium]
MREIIKQASTVDEAIELALRELNLTREQVTCEVLEYPEKRFFFKKPAKVKVCEIEEEFSVKDLFEEPKAEPKKAEPKAEKAPKQENKKAEKPAKETKKAEKPAKHEKPKAEPVAEETEEAKTETALEEIPMENATSKVKYSMEFIKSVIGQF